LSVFQELQDGRAKILRRRQTDITQKDMIKKGGFDEKGSMPSWKCQIEAGEAENSVSFPTGWKEKIAPLENKKKPSTRAI